MAQTRNSPHTDAEINEKFTAIQKTIDQFSSVDYLSAEDIKKLEETLDALNKIKQEFDQPHELSRRPANNEDPLANTDGAPEIHQDDEAHIRQVEASVLQHTTIKNGLTALDETFKELWTEIAANNFHRNILKKNDTINPLHYFISHPEEFKIGEKGFNARDKIGAKHSDKLLDLVNNVQKIISENDETIDTLYQLKDAYQNLYDYLPAQSPSEPVRKKVEDAKNKNLEQIKEFNAALGVINDEIKQSPNITLVKIAELINTQATKNKQFGFISKQFSTKLTNATKDNVSITPDVALDLQTELANFYKSLNNVIKEKSDQEKLISGLNILQQHILSSALDTITDDKKVPEVLAEHAKLMQDSQSKSHLIELATLLKAAKPDKPLVEEIHQGYIKALSNTPPETPLFKFLSKSKSKFEDQHTGLAFKENINALKDKFSQLFAVADVGKIGFPKLNQIPNDLYPEDSEFTKHLKNINLSLNSILTVDFKSDDPSKLTTNQKLELAEKIAEFDNAKNIYQKYYTTLPSESPLKDLNVTSSFHPTLLNLSNILLTIENNLRKLNLPAGYTDRKLAAQVEKIKKLADAQLDGEVKNLLNDFANAASHQVLVKNATENFKKICDQLKNKVDVVENATARNGLAAIEEMFGVQRELNKDQSAKESFLNKRDLRDRYESLVDAIEAEIKLVRKEYQALPYAKRQEMARETKFLDHLLNVLKAAPDRTEINIQEHLKTLGKCIGDFEASYKNQSKILDHMLKIMDLAYRMEEPLKDLRSMPADSVKTIPTFASKSQWFNKDISYETAFKTLFPNAVVDPNNTEPVLESKKDSGSKYSHAIEDKSGNQYLASGYEIHGGKDHVMWATHIEMRDNDSHVRIDSVKNPYNSKDIWNNIVAHEVLNHEDFKPYFAQPSGDTAKQQITTAIQSIYKSLILSGESWSDQSFLAKKIADQLRQLNDIPTPNYTSLGKKLAEQFHQQLYTNHGSFLGGANNVPNIEIMRQAAKLIEEYRERIKGNIDQTIGIKGNDPVLVQAMVLYAEAKNYTYDNYSAFHAFKATTKQIDAVKAILPEITPVEVTRAKTTERVVDKVQNLKEDYIRMRRH